MQVEGPLVDQDDWQYDKDTAKYQNPSGRAAPACETSNSQAGTDCCGRRRSEGISRYQATRRPGGAGVEQRLLQCRNTLFDQPIQLGADFAELLLGNFEAAFVGRRRSVGGTAGADHCNEQPLRNGRALRLVEFGQRLLALQLLLDGVQSLADRVQFGVKFARRCG